MAIKYAKDADTLLRVLKTAQNGDVIKLEPGRYGSIDIRDLKFTDVTVESKYASKPALLTELIVRDSSGLNFRNLEVFIDPARADRPLLVIGSKDIHLSGLNVHGRIDATPRNEGSGLMIRNSTDVSVRGSEFHHLWNALEHLENRGLVISGNSFHDIGTDGIRGGGSSDVVISRNFFTNFYPIEGDHPDAIQFWTGNTKGSVKNIVVDENVFVRGSGAMVQGIFFRDQTEKTPYQNVTITDNLVIGGLGNGIYANGVHKLTIKNNIVNSTPEQKSWVRVDDSKGVEIVGNEAPLYLEEGIQKAMPNNATNSPVHDGGKASFSVWTKEHGAVGHKAAAPTPPTGPAPAPKPAPAPNPTSGQETAQVTGTAAKDVLVATDAKRDSALTGHGSDDQLRGGNLNDILVGSAGNDLLRGGRGADQFRFFGTEIEGPSDSDRIADLKFGEGDTLVFGSFGKGTFVDGAGINAFSGGTAAIISSYDGIVKAAAGSNKVTAYREAPGSSNLVVRVVDKDGQVQLMTIDGGYAQYLAAGGTDWL